MPRSQERGIFVFAKQKLRSGGSRLRLCKREPRPLRQIKRLIRKNGAFLFLRFYCRSSWVAASPRIEACPELADGAHRQRVFDTALTGLLSPNGFRLIRPASSQPSCRLSNQLFALLPDNCSTTCRGASA